MPDLQIPAWLVAVLGAGLPAAGWFGRKFFERRWAKKDRTEKRSEKNLEEQRQLLLDLNGELYNNWIWLADHSEAQDRQKAEPVANKIGSWLYKHSSHFPDPVRPTMVVLADFTFHLATERRAEVLQRREDLLPGMWAYLRHYQREIETKLGLN